MSHEYRNNLDKTNTECVNAMLNDMPLFVEDYYDHMRSGNLSTNTIRSYMYEVNVFLQFMCTVLKIERINDINVTDLDEIRQSQIEKYVTNSKDGKTLAETAMRRKLSVLKSFYKYYLSIGAITKNPTLQIKGAKVHEKAIVKLDDAQVKALLDCIQNQNGLNDRSKAYSEKVIPRDLAIVKVLLGTGMRISELVGLNVTDFDLTDADHPRFHIIRKGGDDDQVYCVAAVSEAVKEYIDYTRPLLLPSDNENALFLSLQKKRMGVNAIEKMMKKYCAAAGLPDNISPHKLRATFATTVYKNTKDIYAVKDSLHHKSIDTSKHYISDKEERKQSAALAAGTLF